MPRRVPDLGKIDKLIGFEPTMALEAILRTVIAFEQGRTGDWSPGQPAKRPAGAYN